MRFRYSRWDGTQDPFGPTCRRPTSSRSCPTRSSGRRRRGAPRRLLRRACRAGSPGSTRSATVSASAAARGGGARPRRAAREIRERLEEILERERTALVRAGDDARMREAFLDALPPDAPGQIAGAPATTGSPTPQAQRMFDELMEHLREQVMGAYFRNMAQGMRNCRPRSMQRFKDMLAELNGMIEMRERGEAVRLRGFMAAPRRLCSPRTRGRSTSCSSRWRAAWRRCRADVASLSPEQRAELQALAEQVMQDMDLAFEVDRLGANLQGVFPEMPWGEPGARAAARPMPLSGDGRRDGAAARLRGARALDARATTQARRSTTSTRRRSGARSARTAVQDLRRLKQIERMLEEAGLVRRARRPARGHAAGRSQARGARARPRVRGAAARPRGNATRRATSAAWPSRPARPGHGGSATAGRSRCSARCSTRSPRRRPGGARAARARTTSSSSRPSSAPRPRPRCCSTCRSRCRCAGTSCTRRRWRSRCTR